MTQTREPVRAHHDHAAGFVSGEPVDFFGCMALAHVERRVAGRPIQVGVQVFHLRDRFFLDICTHLVERDDADIVKRRPRRFLDYMEEVESGIGQGSQFDGVTQGLARMFGKIDGRQDTLYVIESRRSGAMYG